MSGRGEDRIEGAGTGPVPLRVIPPERPVATARRETYALVPDPSEGASGELPAPSWRRWRIMRAGEEAGAVNLWGWDHRGFPAKHSPIWHGVLGGIERRGDSLDTVFRELVRGLGGEPACQAVELDVTPAPAVVSGDRRASRCCVTCRFWEPVRDVPLATTAGDIGECHIAPPVVVPNLGTRWPSTSAVAWCGMWQHDRRGTQPEADR